LRQSDDFSLDRRAARIAEHAEFADSDICNMSLDHAARDPLDPAALAPWLAFRDGSPQLRQ
jgi:hypothetical protein